MKWVLGVLGGLVVVAVILVMVVVGKYNGMVSLSESVSASWSQVENQLQRRNDLIPNLVNTVKGYAKHEKDVFENIAAARAQLSGAKTVSEKIAANGQLEGALARLLMVVENYPNLKANENFVRLQDELAGTENRIAVERMRYNDVVRQYNVTIRRFPANLIAASFGFQKNDAYFKAEEKAKEVPKVQF